MSRDEDAYLIERMGRMLAEIAIIVNGEQPTGTLWSYHDLPEKVRALQAEVTRLNAPPAAVALPEPAFRLKWRDGAYYVNKPKIGDTDCYTAEQMRALMQTPLAPPAASLSPDREAVARAIEDAEKSWHRNRSDRRTWRMALADAAIKAMQGEQQ